MSTIAEELRELTKAVSDNPGGGGSSLGKHIYGVEWGTNSENDNDCIETEGMRIDESANFSDPVPYVDGDQTSLVRCGSPFDNLYPWSEMKIVKDKVADMVAIPKFWYKWSRDEENLGDYGLRLQIATYAAEGFSLAPAFRARNANDTERDVVYIARYKCGGVLGTGYTNQMPVVDMSRAQFRTAVSTGMAQYGFTGYSLQDYAMFWTWRMLFLVEYATWNGQAAIGYNCGGEVCSTCGGTGGVGGAECSECGGSGVMAPEGPENTGTTNSMPYHTGTMAASLDTPSQGVQYRYIEDPWGGVAEWIDGWYRSGDNISYGCNIILDPTDFSDTENGVNIGELPQNSGWISGWTIPSADGYDWALIPRTDGTTSQDGTDGVADVCGFDGPALGCGGAWDAHPYYGAFGLSSLDASYAYDGIGARLQKLP